MLNCRLKGVAVFVSKVDLMERVCHLTNKIYREMLCFTREEWTTARIITDGPYLYQSLSPSWQNFRTPSRDYRIILSWNLLTRMISTKDGILCSFTSFITTPESSGPLHMSPDIYHTQITEYSLQTIHQPNHFSNVGGKLYYSWFISSDWSFKEHLSRALPTELIFRLLRLIRSDRLVGEYSAELILEIIIKWLQGLGSERPGDLYDRFQSELLQYKALRQSLASTLHFDM